MKMGVGPVQPPKRSRKAVLQMLIFVLMNTTHKLAGANRDVIQTMDFLIALFSGWKKMNMYCAKTIMFGKLLMVNCPKHSLEHCLMGVFGWTNQVLLFFSGVANNFLFVKPGVH